MEKLFHIPKDIKRQLEKSVRIVKEENQDRVILITGREGSGKSLLARQLGYYYSLLLQTKFDMNNIAFTREQFADMVRNFQKNSVVVFDEAFKGLSSKGALSKENKELISLLIECRQRGHIIFIVLPSIFILEKYIAVFRSHSLFNVAISKRNYKHRFYKIYNYNNKLKLYILGQRYMSYSRPKINKKWRFYITPPPTITNEEYEKKKRESFKRNDEEKKIENRIDWEDEIISRKIQYDEEGNKDISDKGMYYLLNKSKSNYFLRKKRIKESKKPPKTPT